MRRQNSHTAATIILLLFVLLSVALPMRSDAALPSLSASQSVTQAGTGDDSGEDTADALSRFLNTENDSGAAGSFSKNTLADLQLFIEDFSLRSYSPA